MTVTFAVSPSATATDFGCVVIAKVAALAVGMKDVTMHLIPGARHILLDERESGAADEAIRIMSDWIKE